jgi:sugar phosphate isomerase/epimerase
MSQIKFGCHGFNWGNKEKGTYDLERIAREIRSAGFEGLDGVGAHSPSELVAASMILAKEGLKVISVGGRDTRRTLELTVAAGINFVSEFSPWLGSDPTPGVPTRQQLEAYCEDAERRATWMAQYGVSLALHPHLNAWVETEDQLDFVMSHSRHLGLMLETGHQGAANHDILGVIRKYGKRITHVHLKDRQQDMSKPHNIRAGVFCELGKGNKKIPFKAILKALEKLGYSGWCAVEQDDISGKVVDSMKISRRYLKSIGY